MIRTLLIFLVLVILYYSLKTVVRAAFKAYRAEDGRRRLRGQDMVRDPQCGTYIVKDRAVFRRIGGRTEHFCSERCARQHEERNRR